MRFIAALSVGLLLITGGRGQVQSGTLVDEPVFGMYYDPQRVHFDRAPARISQRCRELRGRKFVLYAYWKGGSVEYFVLSDDRSETAGVGVVLRGTECVAGLPDWLLYGKGAPDKTRKSVVITASTMHGLATNLLSRYSAAFGGKKQFLQAVSRSGLPVSSLPEVFAGVFQEFAKSP